MELDSSEGEELRHKLHDSGEQNLNILELGEMQNDGKVSPPMPGMTFCSQEDVFNFYLKYAQQEGFGIIRRSTKNGEDGQLKYFTLACARIGKRVSTAKSDFNPRPSIKKDCKAKINVVIGVDGNCTISRAYLEHSHALSPNKVRFFKCNKNLDAYVKKRLEVNDQAGISLSKNYHSLAIEVGGYENLTCTEKDCRNFIAKARELRLGSGDAEALSNYFSRMKMRNPKFFHDEQFDHDGRLKNVFWADARSIAAYHSFGDVVSFDTTYLTNKYDMPFAPFVGVNHHGQTVLLGCGLLSNEDTETYIWLFKTWLDCMSGCPPQAFITDQCFAIQAAVNAVFPNTRYRLCLWHIMRKIPEKLGGLNQYKAVKKIMKRAVHESIDIDEFEATWDKMIKGYYLEENVWLNSLYKDRFRWVPVYVKKNFWAGMSTTQRSESINAFFDGYVGPTTSLKQFVEQYDNALKSKIEKENQADFASYNSSIPLITDCYFEKQLQEAYTNKIFKLFQDELRGLLYCNLLFVKVDGSITTFQVTDVLKGKDGNYKRQVAYHVYFNDVEYDIRCSCLLFEFKGIICRHIAKVLIEKNVKEIHSRYILARWRKDVKHLHGYVKNCYDDAQTSEWKMRYNKLTSHFCNVAEIGANSKEKYEFLMKCVDKALEKLMDDLVWQTKDPRADTSIIEVPSQNASSNKKWHSPLKVRTKGRPPSKRKESKVEQISRRSKKKDLKKQKQGQDDGNSRSKKTKVCQDCNVIEQGSNIAPNVSVVSHFFDEFGTQESIVGRIA